jgi:hypothetical protein
MFVTPIIESKLYQNKAIYKTLTCAYGGFFSLPIPPDQTVVVLGIEWTPFIAPQQAVAAELLQDWLYLNEYQLRIEDGQTKHFLHYRNELNFTKIDNIVVFPTDTLDSALKSFIVTPGAKVITPLFLTFTNEEIRLAVTRTVAPNSTFTMSVLNSTSNEENPPNGLKSVSNLALMENGLSVNYTPPVFPLNTVTPPVGLPGTNTLGFYSAADAAAAMPDPTIIDLQYRYFMLPMFTVHYVILKENLLGTIQ